MSQPTDLGRTATSIVKRSASGPPAHYLTVVEGMTIQRAVPITVEALVLGRDPSRAFHLPDADVSRAHCELRLAGERVLVRDLGSTNGTLLDGSELVGERELPVSSTLQIGAHTLRHELLSAEDVEKHEQFAKEMARARRYVEGLLPPPLSRADLRIDWCFVPSYGLGGDALGYHELQGGSLALYLLDVCGHGIGSAMHSASVLNALRRRTLPDTDFRQPEQVLRGLNEAFPMENHSGMYFTMFYAVLDPVSGRLRYSSAGHPPALLRASAGSIRSQLALKNPPIGITAGRAFGQAETQLDPGERLYLFSDGVFEIRELSFEDFERQVVADDGPRAAAEPRRFYDAACAAAGTHVLEDDFSLMIVERDPARNP
jgi:serine phosphatase RsbU (regulator of sigma subunit)